MRNLEISSEQKNLAVIRNNEFITLILLFHIFLFNLRDISVALIGAKLYVYTLHPVYEVLGIRYEIQG